MSDNFRRWPPTSGFIARGGNGALKQARTQEQLRRLQLGVEPQPVDNDEWADMCILYHLMPVERQKEFWTLHGDKYAKQAFLIQHGHCEWRKPI